MRNRFVFWSFLFHRRTLTRNQQIEAKAEENVAANAAAFEAWIRSHTPLEIRQANVARRHLFRVFNKTKYTQIRDDRLIKKPTTAYMAFTTERLSSSEFKHKNGKESLVAIANEWKDVSESDKQVRPLRYT